MLLTEDSRETSPIFLSEYSFENVNCSFIYVSGYNTSHAVAVLPNFLPTPTQAKIDLMVNKFTGDFNPHY